MKLERSYMKTVFAITLLLSLLNMIIVIGYENFTQHKNTVVRQQEEHLLTITKSISRSLDAYIDDKSDSLFILAQNPIIAEALKMDGSGQVYPEHEYAMKSYYRKFTELDRIQLLNNKGELVYQYPARDNKKERELNTSSLHRVLNSKQLYVTKEYQSAPNQLSIDILQPVVNDNEAVGVLVTTINLNKLYNSLIYPVKAGAKGYAMLKNKEGIIVMHPVKEQIGINSLKVRKERYPKLDWKELEELNRRQVEEEEGYFIYHSKLWQSKEPRWLKKINAFTTYENGDISWIVSVQMDYSEIEQPIRGALVNISMIALFITAFLIIVFFIIFRLEKKRETLEIETKYLKELNKTWDELIKSEARLRHSQKLQTIGMLTSGMVHEFNNLLSPILGYSELLLQSVDSKDSMQDDIMEIKKSALRAKEIIGEILRFSRNDNTAVIAQPVRVRYILEESIRLIKSILPNKIKVVENIGSDVSVLGRATQLQQVLLNIFTNSYHAMKVNGGILELNMETVCIDDSDSIKLGLVKGKYAKIQVRDTGVGMDKETLSQIFDPFFTTKETGEGTGLGLSVAQSIIKQHRGKIIVQSEINAGTVVDIYLPVLEEDFT